MTREEFIIIRNTYLTSARPIQSAEHLKGREKALRSLTDALTSPGKHAFIYGFRGVGKSSLAQTAAFQLQEAIRSPILIACEPSSTFTQLCNDILRLAFRAKPLEIKGQRKITIGASYAGMGGNLGLESNSAPIDLKISSVNEAVSLFRTACERANVGFVIVVDEFDQLTSTEEHQKIAILLKQLSEQNIPVRFIMCGIAATLERLFSQHESIYRQIHSEEVERVSLQARLDIIEDASNALSVSMRDDFKYRIAQISDGFPSFVHLIAEKVFTCAFDLGTDKVDQAAYEQGILEAVGSVELSLKRSYENSLHRNTNKYEHAIWAIANDRLFDVNVDTIWQHYQVVCDQMDIKPVTRQNLNTKLNQLTQDQYGKLLEKVRRSNYTFSEKMMRAYARLRAERHGCQLGPENAALTSRRT